MNLTLPVRGRRWARVIGCRNREGPAEAIPCRLSAVHVRPGDIVRRGDVLAEFDTRELLLRQARIGTQNRADREPAHERHGGASGSPKS
ncbi:biotin/lipoyl-binding protein [Devosia sp. YIM 151766]|uniref:biotin/lipoyl-binding protein n=1 Tax=Devosia sp. YIM 151766 TaxID=3017325 RepID=UPI00255C7655|nr:biotin/lipoyl-binding protein [Devosia sp. YIM 151766]WIY52921.1 biotin/lipoyl-binding protein [Devosia sp. YIM 151766]